MAVDGTRFCGVDYEVAVGHFTATYHAPRPAPKATRRGRQKVAWLQNPIIKGSESGSIRPFTIGAANVGFWIANLPSSLALRSVADNQERSFELLTM